jgi:tripartite-type tricarboxylate transporter receptor subunit TctC
MKFSRRDFLHLGGSAVVLTSVPDVGNTQSYPSRPIRLVVPFAPGGAFDTIGRPLAEKMKPLLGTVIVENIGGGGSSLGAAAVARSRADGYSILLGGTLPHVNEALLKSHPLYDPIKDLEPIANVADTALFLAVSPSLPVHSLRELIAYAKSNPGKLSFGHVGIGSTNHLTGELLKSLTGTPDIVQVPYRGAGPAIQDLIGGQLPMVIAGANGQLLELHRSGKLRILAVTSQTRPTAASEIPTVAEEGLPGLTNKGSIGLLAPAGTPKVIIELIARATHGALAEAAFQQFLREAGYEPDLDSTPEKFRRTLELDIAFWAPIVSSLGLKID